MRVGVLDDFHGVFDSDPAIARLRQRVPVDVLTEHVDAERLRSYQVLIAQRERTKFDAALFSALPELELVANTGNHAYHVDLAAAASADVIVALGSSDLSEMARMAASTIEITFALMLAVMRRVAQTDAAMRRHEWPQPLGYTLSGKTLGILGLGRIGREVARIAQAFGMNVIAWGPTLTDERAAASAAKRMELDALLEAADVVSVHVALSDKSRGLLDESRLRRIGPRGFLVNTARGAIIDEAALARVLADGGIAGAGLDVFVTEPLPRESPLLRLDNVVMTPHLGWPADQTYRYMAEAVVRIVEAHLDGQPFKRLTP